MINNKFVSTSYVWGKSLPEVWLSDCLEAEIKEQGIIWFTAIYEA